MKNLQKIFLSAVIFSLIMCKDKKGSKIDFIFNKGEMLNPKDWKCFNIENEKICIPFSWNYMKQNKVYFFSKLDNNDANTYFVVIKHNQIDTDKYLKETYSQLKKDTLEKFIGFTAKKLIFKDKTTYYADYFTSINNMEYFLAVHKNFKKKIAIDL